MHGVLKLRKMVQGDPDGGWRDRYGARGTEEVLPDADADAAAAVNVPFQSAPES
jgi:hypothetical protein